MMSWCHYKSVDSGHCNSSIHLNLKNKNRDKCDPSCENVPESLLLI